MRKLLLLMLVALALAGCSSSSDTFAVSGPPIDNPTNRPLVGRLVLGFPAGDGEVQVLALQGGELARGSLKKGTFLLRASLPADFRILIRPSGSSAEFSAEVRNYDASRWCQVNVLTSLASLWLRDNGGSLEQAEREVRRLLNLPGYYHLADSPDESTRDPFSHLAFLQQAGRSGGWTSFSQAVLRQSPTTYALTQTVLTQPIQGLEPGLNALVESNRVNVAQRTVFAGVGPGSGALGKTGAALARQSKGEVEVAAGSLVTEFIFGCATGVGGNIASAGINGAVGWAASMMGLSYGTSGQLQQISQQLTGVQQTLNELVASLANAEQQALVNTVNTSGANSISSMFAVVNTTVGGALNGSFQPGAPVNVSYSYNMITQLQGSDWFGMVSNITNYMLGTNGSSNLIINSQNSAMALYGLDTPASLQGFPWRYSGFIDYSLTTYSKYGGFQEQGLYLEAEKQHFSANPGGTFPPAGTSYRDPVLGITQLFGDFATGLQWLRQERTQIPLAPPRGDLTLDLEYGMMWYCGLQPEQKYEDAVSIAEAASWSSTTPLPDGTSITYSDWRLPTFNELLVLQARGTFNPQAQAITNSTSAPPVNSNNAYPDYGQTTSGLVGLGFFNMKSNLLSGDGDVWLQAWTAQNPPVEEQGYEFRLNHKSDNTSQKSGGTERPFLIVRTFGTRPVVNPTLYSSTGSTPAAYPSVTLGSNPTNGEMACYGTAQSISGATAVPLASPLPSPIPSPLSVPLMQASATLNFSLDIAGGTIGVTPNTVSFDVRSASYSGTASTLAANGLPNTLGQLATYTTSLANILSNYFANIPGLDGLLVPITSGSTSLTVGYGSLSTSSNVTAAAVPATLTSVQVQPRNVQYGASSSLPVSGSSANYPLYLTAFYNNGSVASVGGQATWNVTSPGLNLTGIADINTSTGTATLQLNVPPQANPQAFNITIQASYQGQTDSTTMQILPALQ